MDFSSADGLYSLKRVGSLQPLREGASHDQNKRKRVGRNGNSLEFDFVIPTIRTIRAVKADGEISVVEQPTQLWVLLDNPKISEGRLGLLSSARLRFLLRFLERWLTVATFCYLLSSLRVHFIFQRRTACRKMLDGEGPPFVATIGKSSAIPTKAPIASGGLHPGQSCLLRFLDVSSIFAEKRTALITPDKSDGLVFKKIPISSSDL